MIDPSSIDRVDAELARLARLSVRGRLQLGELLVRLGDRHRELGFRTFGAYVRERLSLGARWCADTRRLAERLGERPAIRAALLCQRIGWSMAELLARASTPEDAAELLEASRGLTVHELREALRERGEAEPEPVRLCTIDVPMNARERVAMEALRRAVEHVNGGPGPVGEWLDCALGEASSTLIGLLPDASFDVDEVATPPRGAGPPPPPPPANEVVVSEEVVPECSDEPAALDRAARDVAFGLASRELWLGEMLRPFFRAHGWRELGYGSEQQYCDERLGMARASARKRIALAERTEWIHALGEAVREGWLGVEHATLVARVSNPDTVGSWIDRARRRTFKHLHEDVLAVELAADLLGEPPRTSPPPNDELRQTVERFERDALSGESYARIISDARRELEAESVQISACLEPGERIGDDGTTRRHMRLRAPEHVIAHYRALERELARSGLPFTFPMFLAMSFWVAWAERFHEGTRYKHVHDRDRHRCTSPVCSSHNVTDHHLTYRAHGGGDEPSNNISVCDFCHLDGEHGGRLKVRGTADALTWWLGRTPVMRVDGRELTQL